MTTKSFVFVLIFFIMTSTWISTYFLDMVWIKSTSLIEVIHFYHDIHVLGCDSTDNIFPPDNVYPQRCALLENINHRNILYNSFGNLPKRDKFSFVHVNICIMCSLTPWFGPSSKWRCFHITGHNHDNISGNTVRKHAKLSSARVQTLPRYPSDHQVLKYPWPQRSYQTLKGMLNCGLIAL